MFKVLSAAILVAAASFASTASAATLNGTFNVTAVNVTNLNANQSKAWIGKFDAALADTLGGANSVSVSDSFTYEGDIDFGTYLTSGPNHDATTIADWLETGGGVVTDLDAAFGGMQLSKGSIGNGTATTTFFMFEAITAITAPTFEVAHDDGFRIFEDDMGVGGVNGPIGLTNTTVTGYDGGAFDLLYVATNGDPSVLEVQAVPLPATLPLLMAGFGGLAFMRRKRAA